MRVVIHPGWSKTGTTAIQNYFATHCDALRAHGVVYPRSGRLFDNALHGFSLSLRPLEGLEADRPASEIIAGIVAEAEGMDVLVLSSELLPVLFDYSEMAPIWELATSIDVVFTIRRQSDLFISLCKQIMADPAIVEELTVEGLFEKHLDWLNFSHGIGAWRKAPEFTERTRYMVLPYSRDGMVARFMKLLELDFPDVLSVDSNVAANVSMSDFQVAVLNSMLSVRSGLDLQERIDLREFVSKRVTQEPIGFRLLSEQERNLIDIFYASSNSAVAEEFMGRQSLFEARSSSTSLYGENKQLVNYIARKVAADFLE